MPIKVGIIRNRRKDTLPVVTGASAYAKIEADLLRYTRIRLAKLWRDAIRAWIEAVVKAWVTGGHVDTGMSLASLLPLARTSVQPFSKTMNIRSVSVVKAGLAKRKRKLRRNQYVIMQDNGSYQGIDKSKHKSMAQGERDGADMFVVSVGPPRNPELRFQFNINVFQWQFHEGTQYSISIGILSLVRGNDAFRAYIRANYSKYLSKADYVRIIQGKGVPNV